MMYFLFSIFVITCGTLLALSILAPMFRREFHDAPILSARTRQEDGVMWVTAKTSLMAYVDDENREEVDLEIETVLGKLPIYPYMPGCYLEIIRTDSYPRIDAVSADFVRKTGVDFVKYKGCKHLSVASKYVVVADAKSMYTAIVKDDRGKVVMDGVAMEKIGMCQIMIPIK